MVVIVDGPVIVIVIVGLGMRVIVLQAGVFSSVILSGITTTIATLIVVIVVGVFAGKTDPTHLRPLLPLFLLSIRLWSFIFFLVGW